jgi:hypothetical protein
VSSDKSPEILIADGADNRIVLVQAVVLGSGEVYGVQYREIPRRDPPQADLREIKEKIRELKRRRAAIGASGSYR